MRTPNVRISRDTFARVAMQMGHQNVHALARARTALTHRFLRLDVLYAPVRMCVPFLYNCTTIRARI